MWNGKLYSTPQMPTVSLIGGHRMREYVVLKVGVWSHNTTTGYTAKQKGVMPRRYWLTSQN